MLKYEQRKINLGNPDCLLMGSFIKQTVFTIKILFLMKAIRPILSTITIASILSCSTSNKTSIDPIKEKTENLGNPYLKQMINPPIPSLGLDTFYKKYSDAYGIPIVSSEKVPDDALLIARDIVNYMLVKRPDIRSTLIRQKARVLVMAKSEMETDLPERSNWKKPTKEDKRLTPGERENYDKPGGIASMSDKEYWNKRARGMGGTITSCAEENLLGYPNTRYYGENILVHEFSHNIMNAIRFCDTTLYREIIEAYEAARTKGKYKGQYAINTSAEYWAEGTQWWFWSNYEFYDGDKRIQSPDDLKDYDPVLFKLLERIYIGHQNPADIYYGKNLKPYKRK